MTLNQIPIARLSAFLALAALLAFIVFSSSARAQTFVDLGGDGLDAKVSADGELAVVQSGDDCVVTDLSTAATHTFTGIPNATTGCIDIRAAGFSPGFRIVANTHGVCFSVAGSDCAYQSTSSGYAQAAGYHGVALDVNDSADPSTDVVVGAGRALGSSSAAPYTPAASSPLFGQAFPYRLPAPGDREPGAFDGVSPSGAWFGGFMLEPSLLANRPFVYHVGDPYGFELPGIDVVGAAEVHAVADDGPTSFIAVGQGLDFDRLVGADSNGDPVYADVEIGLRWDGVAAPTALLAGGIECGAAALSINRDASFTVGEGCGLPAIWSGTDPSASILSSWLQTISSPIPVGWELGPITDIALDADVVVGVGTFNGSPRAWAIDFEGTPVPEPSSSSALAAGVLGLVVAMRRRSSAR